MKVIIFVFSFLYGAEMIAQTDSIAGKLMRGPVYWGKDILPIGVVPVADGGAIIVKPKGNGIWIELFNAKMELIKSVGRKKQKRNGRIKFCEGAFSFNNRVYLRYRLYHSDEKSTELIYDELDCTNLSVIREITGVKFKQKSFTTEDFRNSSGIRYFYERQEMGFADSPDQYYHLQYGSSFGDGYEVPENVTVAVFDSTMNRVWEREIEIPIWNGRFHIKCALVDNEGNAFILGAENLDGDLTYSGAETPTNYLLIRIGRHGGMTTCPLGLNGAFMERPGLCFTNDGYLLLAGFYGLTSTQVMNGIYTYKVDAVTMNLIQSTQEEFDPAWVKEVCSSSASHKPRYLKELEKLEGLGAVKIVLGENDSWFVITEMGYSLEGLGSNSRLIFGSDSARNDILIFKIRNNGSIEWTQNIDKYNYFMSMWSRSYLLADCNGKMNMIYDNTELETISLVSLNHVGSFESEVLLKNKPGYTILDLTRSVKFSNCRYILFFKEGKKYRLGVLNLDED